MKSSLGAEPQFSTFATGGFFVMHVREREVAFAQEDLALYQTAVEGVVRVSLADKSYVSVSGDDRKGWLQGQATNDLRSFTPGSSTAFCFCKPTGQIIAPVTAWALGDRMVLALPTVCVPAALERFEQMVVMEDVEATLLAGEAVGVQGPEATAWLGERLALPSMDAAATELDGKPVLALRSNRTGLGGWDLVFPDGMAAKTRKWLDGLVLLEGRAREALRLEAGLPLWGADFGERTLPPELGPQFEARYVSYTKGCYTGQEVLMRIFSRGHTNRTWCGLVSPVALAVGAPLVTQSGQEVGTVTSVAFSPELGHVGAAMIRNGSNDPGSKLVCGGTEVEVRRMPLI